MFLLCHRVTHADADGAALVQPVTRLVTLERAVWLSAVVVVPAVNQNTSRRRGRHLVMMTMMMMAVVMVT